jgi:hypothetical protein
MARPNYNAVKRAKELKRKAKRDAKLARKHAKKAGEGGDAEPATDELAPDRDGGPSERGEGQAI